MGTPPNTTKPNETQTILGQCRKIIFQTHWSGSMSDITDVKNLQVTGFPSAMAQLNWMVELPGRKFRIRKNGANRSNRWWLLNMQLNAQEWMGCWQVSLSITTKNPVHMNQPAGSTKIWGPFLRPQWSSKEKLMACKQHNLRWLGCGLCGSGVGMG